MRMHLSVQLPNTYNLKVLALLTEADYPTAGLQGIPCMDRPKRAATKVSDFCRYHLSGDLSEQLQGQVNLPIQHFEMAGGTDELKQQLENEKEHSKQLQEEAELMQVQHDLEIEKQKQKQWQVAMEEIRMAREHADREHEKCLEKIKEMASASRTQATNSTLDWLKAQLQDMQKAPDTPSEADRERQAKEAEIKELRDQQEAINQKLKELTGQDNPSRPIEDVRRVLTQDKTNNGQQNMLMDQLRAALTARKEEDPNKALLKALASSHNRTGAEGGTNTLKPNLLHGILGGETSNTMADWLANLNKQEEGESDAIYLGEGESSAKQGKCKSGILERATSNIQDKQVWPQQNLAEDWADEDVEFKQMKFKHLVAGETRTIETATDPAQILGRLRLLCRIAYLKLWGYEWNLIQKMYAVIITSIETKEYSWESNYDRFKTILYRKVVSDNRGFSEGRQDREQGRKRFCKDYNKPDRCPRPSPHPAWFGARVSAVKRTVYHYCAACLIQDKQNREHPEGHPDCPHKA